MALAIRSLIRKYSSAAGKAPHEVLKHKFQMYPNYLIELEHCKHSESGRKRWKFISLFVASPLTALTLVHLYLEHKKHPHGRDPFVEYEYLRVKNKRYPWGDGTKTLFFNPAVNATAAGYED